MKVEIQKCKIGAVMQNASMVSSKIKVDLLKSAWICAEDDNLVITTNNGTVEYKAILRCAVQEEGKIGINGTMCFNIIKYLKDGEIFIEDKDENMQIKQGSVVCKLPQVNPESEMPVVLLPDGKSIDIATDLFMQAINKIAFCAGDAMSSEEMQCVNIRPIKDGFVEFRSLNGHQFGRYLIVDDNFHNALPEEGILINASYVAQINSFISASDVVSIKIDDKRFFVSLERDDIVEYMSFPLSFASYPDCDVFLSKIKNTKGFTINKKSLSSSLKLNEAFKEKDRDKIIFELSSKKLLVTSGDTAKGCLQEAFEINYNGDIEKIGFPLSSIQNILTHLDGEDINIEFTGEEGPCAIFEVGNDDYLIVIMPIALRNYIYNDNDD